MHKMLFARHIFGNMDKELIEFAKQRFDILSVHINGTQMAGIEDIAKFIKENGLLFYPRTSIFSNTLVEDAVSCIHQMMTAGANGVILQGHSTEEQIDELLSRFQRIAESVSPNSRLVFLVEETHLSKLIKTLNRDDFPPIDARSAVRIPAKNLISGSQSAFRSKPNLLVIDFGSSFSNSDYEKVERILFDNHLDVVAYMTYDMMSLELREAILDYGKPKEVSTEPERVMALHDLMVRESPNGLVLKDESGKVITIIAGSETKLLSESRSYGDTWYRIERSPSHKGEAWIAGVIGKTTYSKILTGAETIDMT